MFNVDDCFSPIEKINRKTHNQLVGIILLDCIDQCNKLSHVQKFDEETYEKHLRAMLKERLKPEGQKEFPI